MAKIRRLHHSMLAWDADAETLRVARPSVNELTSECVALPVGVGQAQEEPGPLANGIRQLDGSSAPRHGGFGVIVSPAPSLKECITACETHKRKT